MVVASRFLFLGCFFPLVSMMQSTDPRQSDYLAFSGRSGLYRPLVRPFHYGQLLAKRKVLGSEIRSNSEFQPNEQNKITKHFHHEYSLARACKFVNDFRKYE